MTKATGQDKTDLTKLATTVSHYGGMADLSDLAGRNGDTGLTGHRIRTLVATYGEHYGIKYHASTYHRGDRSNSNYFGKAGSGFGGYERATVSITRELHRRIRRRRTAK